MTGAWRQVAPASPEYSIFTFATAPPLTSYGRTVTGLRSIVLFPSSSGRNATVRIGTLVWSADDVNVASRSTRVENGHTSWVPVVTSLYDALPAGRSATSMLPKYGEDAISVPSR